MTSPYDSMPSRAYWRSAVAERNPLEFEDVYRRKFEIADSDNIGCAGSCFAQHVGNRLKSSGFAYLDVEPPPALLPQAEHGKYGYGIYSARFGNIYTVRQLAQLFDRAFDTFEPVDSVWETDGHFFDAFRPTIEPEGFESADEVVVLRKAHLVRTRTLFETVNVFVFTLGLTETWLSRVDGAAYPLCPGTAAGSFDDTKYVFCNFGFAEIYGDMDALLRKWRAVNPTVRFILTVSPVPLTATASGDHVLAATTYSKSVLRAVAGELAQRDYIDYFPSYELISAPSQRGFFFAGNMRSVTNAGVEFAMGHFFSQHRFSRSAEHSHPGQPATSAATPRVMTDDDIICDEILLDTEAA